MSSRPGRPPLDPQERSVKVTISLPAKHYDRYCADARKLDMSLPEAIRRDLYKELARKTRQS